MNATATLSLLQLKGIGRRLAWRIAQTAPQPVEDPATLREELERQRPHIGLKVLPSPAEIGEAWQIASATVARCADLEIQVISASDSRYPAPLIRIPDPPPILFVRGDLGGFRQPAIAVIGTREPTTHGIEMAPRIAQRLVVRGLTVISGLAFGCDALAHDGALRGQGRTIAVLPAGVEQAYPVSHQALADDIIATGGALLSEYPPGTRPFPTNFVERDRLQSGLSAGIVVIETGEKGGTMHTVRFATDQQRAIAVLQHPPEYSGHEKTKGNANLLLSPGVRPISTLKDVDAFARAAQLAWPNLTTRPPNLERHHRISQWDNDKQL